MAEGAYLVRTAPTFFLRWWLRELGSFVPAWLKPGAERRRAALVLNVREDETVLHASTAGGDQEIGRAEDARAGHDSGGLSALGERRFRRWPVVVRLAAQLGMRKTMDLPLGARDSLDSLLRFELDRLTPFKADELYIAWHILETHPAEGRMTVALEMAPKALVGPAIDGVTGFARSVDRVEIESSNEQQPLNLLPEAAAPSGEKGWFSRILPLLAIALALVSAWIPIHRQQRQIERLDEAVAAVKMTAEESLALGDRLDAQLSKAGFLTKTRNDQPGMTRLLAELTELLPDQSYLVHLEIDGGGVTLQGLADKASDLITILDQSATFASPQFRSPVTRDPRSGKERFQIMVELSGRPL
ncbi:MAG: PilN domain-containing protein [Geminicoccaceae bacterium]